MTIHDDRGVCVQVASAEMLLAMKLFAAEKRYLREAEDLAVLLRATAVASVERAEEIYSAFYPGDAFSGRLVALVSAILAAPDRVEAAPPLPTLA